MKGWRQDVGYKHV